MAYKISKDEMIKPSASAIELTDGIYYTTIVGYIIHKKAAFNEGDDPFDAVRFALQLVDDAGKNKILQTNDWRISLAEKSKLFTQLAGWVKASSPNDLWERLEKANFMDTDGNLNFDKFLGTHPAIMVKMVPSKKDASKTYPDITLAATKKGQEHKVEHTDWDEGGQAVPLWIGDFIVPEDVVETSCLEGFEWKRYEKKEDDQPKTREERVNMPPQKQVHSTMAKEPAENVQAPKSDAKEDKPATTGKVSDRLVIRKRNATTTSKQQAEQAEAVPEGDCGGNVKDDELPF